MAREGTDQLDIVFEPQLPIRHCWGPWRHDRGLRRHDPARIIVAHDLIVVVQRSSSWPTPRTAATCGADLVLVVLHFGMGSGGPAPAGFSGG